VLLLFFVILLVLIFYFRGVSLDRPPTNKEAISNTTMNLMESSIQAQDKRILFFFVFLFISNLYMFTIEALNKKEEIIKTKFKLWQYIFIHSSIASYI
jgi:hypothetical protein